MKFVIDTNIFVSSLDPNDIFHIECYPIFNKILEFEIQAACPALILAETCCILNRRTNDKDFTRRIYQRLSIVPSIVWLPLTLEVSENACELGIKTGLKGADSIILQAAEQYGIPLITKDKEIQKKAPSNVLVFDPEELKSHLK